MATWTSVLRPFGVNSDGIISSGVDRASLPLLCTLPHCGERVPTDAAWLNQLSEQILFEDVDRYTDELYSEVLKRNSVAWILTEWHRYCGDLNREESDIDQDAVIGAPSASGTHPRGLIWVRTTKGTRLLPKPLVGEALNTLVHRVHRPFHKQVQMHLDGLRARFGTPVFHLDLHSMPSRGTSEHRDPGEIRPDLVISDQRGKSAANDFVQLIFKAAAQVGFSTAYNWPYFGGKITERYGQPTLGVHTVQIELNRSLYMDESTKLKLSAKFHETQNRLTRFLGEIECQLAIVRDRLLE